MIKLQRKESEKSVIKILLNMNKELRRNKEKLNNNVSIIFWST